MFKTCLNLSKLVTCQSLIRSHPAVFVMVMSMMELCPLEFKNVGVVPLLAQDRPQVVGNSSNSSPLVVYI